MPKVFIDPGHGGHDPGAVCNNRRESDDNLRLSDALARLLKRQGIEIMQSRVGDSDVSISERVSAANSWQADLFVSLHRNAFSLPSACGTELWVYSNPTPEEMTVAGTIMAALCSAPTQQDRGVKRGNYGVLRDSRMPAVLVELGFITNSTDNELFDKYLDEYAEVLCLGICAAVGVSYSDDARESEEESHEKLFRVQAGAFKNRSSAERLVSKLYEMGIDAFVV